MGCLTFKRGSSILVDVSDGVEAIAGLETSSPVDPHRSSVLRNPAASRASNATDGKWGSVVSQPQMKDRLMSQHQTVSVNRPASALEVR